MSPAGGQVLPELREDLQIVEEPAGRDGAVFWQVHDPLQHRFFRVSDDTRRIMAVWDADKTFEEFIAIARDRIGIELTPAQLHQFVYFLHSAHLCKPSADGAWSEMKKRRDGGGLSPVRLFASLISLRLPLFNPEPFLRAVEPVTNLVFSRGFTLLALSVMLSGLYISAFDILATITNSLDSFSLPGLFQIGIALVVLKTCHELGHAVAAYRAGCRVPTIGIAFMVFIPLLYTDVSDAWRLQSRNQRILISASGMIVEIYIAGLATFLWAFLDDGATRDILFYIATVGWISSLAFNLNPLVKFDGYYILSDFLGIANLQSRSTELARWKLRQTILRTKLQPPETFSRQAAAALISFSFLSWAYRLTIFLGIAYLLYGFTAKIIGIALLAMTLWLFIAMPVWRELRMWWTLMSAPGSGASVNRPMLISVALLIFFFIPFSGAVYAPSVLVANDLQKVFPPSNARIAAIHISQSSLVSKGDALVDFEIPELEAELVKVDLELDARKRQLGRAVSSREDRSNLTVLRNEITALEQRKANLVAEMDELRVISRNDGRVVQVSKELRAGNWISQTRWVALVRSGNELIARGYLSAADISKIAIGSPGKFVPDDPARSPVRLVVSRLSSDVARLIELPELASIYGGPIETHSNALLPAQPVFSIEFRITGDIDSPEQVLRGMVVIEGRRESLAQIAWRRIAKVFVKESAL